MGDTVPLLGVKSKDGPKHDEEHGHPNETKKVPPAVFRYIFLFFACILPLGSQDLYDAPAAMGPKFMEQYGIGPFQIGQLYSFWALPNLILVFFSGIFVDRVGPDVASMVFNAIIMAGSTVVFFSGSSYLMLQVGFITYGVGAGSVLVAQQTALTQWFKGSELALSFGISTVALRALSFMDYNVHPYLANKIGVKETLWVPFGISIASMGATVICVAMNRYRARHYKVDHHEPEKISFAHLRHMNPLFWVLTILCLALSQSELSFEMFAVNILTSASYGVNLEEAGRVVSSASITIMILAPVIASLADRFGFFGHFMILGSLLCAGGGILAVFLPTLPGGILPYVCLAIYGAGYGVGVAVIWPAVGILVDEAHVGTAFGIVSGVLNIGFFVLPLVIGSLYDHEGNYYFSLVLLVCLALTALICAVVITAVDEARGGLLRMGTHGMAAAIMEKNKHIAAHRHWMEIKHIIHAGRRFALALRRPPALIDPLDHGIALRLVR